MEVEAKNRSGLAFFGTLPGLISAIAALLMGLAAIGVIRANPPEPSPSPTPGPTEGPVVVVPNVVGWQIDDAIKEVEGAGLNHQVTAEASDTVQPAHVTRQNLPGGAEVEEGTVILLWEAFVADDWPDYPGSVAVGDTGRVALAWQEILISCGALSDIPENLDAEFGAATGQKVKQLESHWGWDDADTTADRLTYNRIVQLGCA